MFFYNKGHRGRENIQETPRGITVKYNKYNARQVS